MASEPLDKNSISISRRVFGRRSVPKVQQPCRRYHQLAAQPSGLAACKGLFHGPMGKCDVQRPYAKSMAFVKFAFPIPSCQPFARRGWHLDEEGLVRQERRTAK